MLTSMLEKNLPIVEVPEELRGMSDEEILKKGEREDSPKRRCAAKRLSKRERLAIKVQKEKAQMQKIAQSVDAEFFEKSATAHEKKPEVSESKPAPRVLKCVVASVPAKTGSGRVLKGSFSSVRGEHPRAVVVSPKDSVQGKTETGKDAAIPPKRPRGRPRKNPLP